MNEVNIVDVQMLCEHWAKLQVPGHLRTSGAEECFNSIVQEVRFQEACGVIHDGTVRFVTTTSMDALARR